MPLSRPEAKREEQPIRLLYIEDDPAFADMTRSFLEETALDLEIVVEQRGDDARERIERESDQFDCIVSDYELPGEDGLALLDVVRSIDAALPFLIFTGKGNEEIAGTAISKGATDYIQKQTGAEQFQLLANRIENAVEQYRTQQTLTHERIRTNFALERTATLIFEVDLATRRVQRIGGFENVFGLSEQEVQTWPAFVETAVHPEDQAVVRDAFEQFDAGELEYTTLEYRTTPDAGDPRWIGAELFIADSATSDQYLGSAPATARALSLSDSGDHIIGVARDITDQKRFEQELQQAKTRYEQLVQQNLVGLYIARDGTIVYHNPTFAELLGYDPEENQLAGESFTSLVAQSDQDRLQELLRQLQTRTYKGDRRPYLVQTADGTQREIQLFGRGVAVDGKPAVLGTVVDMQTASQDEWKLQRERERIQQLTSYISHDLQNPLSVAKGHLELAQADSPDNEHLDNVATAIDRMEALVDDLLTLATQSRTVDETEPIGLSGLATTTWDNVATANATLEVTTTGTIEADPDRIKSVFENLYRNAVEHVGPDVTIRVGDLEDGFYIEDDGPGIPEEDREQVFESGYSTADAGTGFGLAIVKETVESHGWQVELTDGELGGARFEIHGAKQPVRPQATES